MISALLTAVIPALLLPWLLLPLQSPPLFAILPVAPLAIVFARAIRRGEHRGAVALALAWAAAITISTIAVCAARPDAAARGIWRAGAFRDEMLHWIATGAGPEGSIALFLPRVLTEFGVLLLLSALSLGALGLLLGSLLLGYMNGYVGWVVAHGDPGTPAFAAALVAWPPWSIARVISFVLAGTAAAAWGHRVGWSRWFPGRAGAAASGEAGVGRLLLASLALLATDAFLKWWLAPIWREWLHALLGASAGLEAGGTG